MGGESRLEVIDREGWQKEYPLNKSIIHIGSDARSDILLEEKHGAGVAPLHLQLISTSETGGSYRLVNLGYGDILLGAAGERTLSPRATHELAEGDTLKVGDFILIYHGQAAVVGGGTASTGQRIGLSLFMPRLQIPPHQTVNGVITVRNLGDKGGVKINLELEGLDPDCFHLEPGPLLSSGAEKEVFFSVHHRGHKPVAGDYRINIYATAPKAYPTEFVTVSQAIQILPFYSHKLRLISSDAAKVKPTPTTAQPEQPVIPSVEPIPAAEPVLPLAPEVGDALMEADSVTTNHKPASPDDWWSAEAEPIPRPVLITPPAPVEVAPPPEVVKVEAEVVAPVEVAAVVPAEPILPVTASPPEPIMPSPVVVEPPGTARAERVEVEIVDEVSPVLPVESEPVLPPEPPPPAEEVSVPLPVVAEPSAPPTWLDPPASQEAWAPTPPPTPLIEPITESQPAPETETSSPVVPVIKPKRPRTKTGTQPKVQVESKPAPDTSAEDWWGAEPEAKPSEEKPKVIKLKAAPQAGPTEPPPSPSIGAPAQTEDWWGDTDEE